MNQLLVRTLIAVWALPNLQAPSPAGTRALEAALRDPDERVRAEAEQGAPDRPAAGSSEVRWVQIPLCTSIAGRILLIQPSEWMDKGFLAMDNAIAYSATSRTKRPDADYSGGSH